MPFVRTMASAVAFATACCPVACEGGVGHEHAADPRPVLQPASLAIAGPDDLVLGRIDPPPLLAPLGEGERTISAFVPEVSPVRIVYNGSRTAGKIALTFDDGPSRENTPHVLRILRRLGARATFFVEGRRVERFPELTRRIVEEGHEIAVHGYSHAPFRSLFPSQIVDEIERTRALVRAATGRDPRLLRPPFGGTPESAMPLFEELGVDIVMWTVDSRDWEGKGTVVRARDVDPGDIVLLHDRIAATAEALPGILLELRQAGLEPVTVSELTGLEPYVDRGRRRAVDRDCTP